MSLHLNIIAQAYNISYTVLYWCHSAPYAENFFGGSSLKWGVEGGDIDMPKTSRGVGIEEGVSPSPAD